MKRRSVAALIVCLIGVLPATSQQSTSPTETVISFYKELRSKRYVEGFKYSVYRGAVENLSPAELKELEPEFARTFSSIPEKIEPRGEKILGDTASVILKFEGLDQPQEVALIRVDDQWVVGDKDSLEMVRSQGPAFFFNTRMLVNEAEAFEMLSRIVGAELIYSRKFEGRFATLNELIKLGGVPKDIGDESGGYRIVLDLAADQKAFKTTATPILYGKTGRLSFYADSSGVRGEDLKGRVATASSPVYQPK